MDPTLGSYYLESLIAAIEEKSWDDFLALEQQGSYSELFDRGIVKSIIEQDEKLGSDAALSRNEIHIGANTFQNIGEPLTLETASTESSIYLAPIRACWKIEQIRKRTEDFVNKHGQDSRPTASIVLFGTDPIAKAKADFTYSFLGIAGIKIVEEIILQEISELEKLKDQLNSQLIVYCYQEVPALEPKHFRHQTAKVLIAGKEAREPEWKQNGLYACINRHTDTFSLLHNLLNDLNISV